ncbi:acyltransferase family protein [Paradesertivirga mongoliensis]|uniref:Acyltransferase family protein n=1 Tax=Paradesertivirga mongoliensis TaxID=2100740 RepID=A0ABW4ZH74_9SPHI|nr:acyltransferase [Pedobacter mongoliensis]
MALTNRIRTLDGLRAIAALGVLWIHCWNIHGNPSLVVWGVNVTNLLVLAGNGVDLFFVISGFCMYYFYGSKRSFSHPDYWNFIKKRWKRLSPVFYIATLVYILFRWNENSVDKIVPQFLTSVFYLNSISKFNIEGFLWSLGPEWQFYLLVPFLFIYQNKIGFEKTLTILSLFMLIVAIACIFILKRQSDLLADQIILRYFEFLWGIVAAYIVKNKTYITRFKGLWFMGFTIIAYSGRVFLSRPVLSLSVDYYNFFKLVGFSLMGLGFAGIIYLSVLSNKWLYLILGNRPISLLGRVSYSFYLWHGLIHHLISRHITFYIDVNDIRAPLFTFILSALILTPISMLSYNVLEAPFLYHKSKS